MPSENTTLKRSLINRIEDCVENDPANSAEDGTRYFDDPLTGFASASDELFERYRSIIGPFHWTPSQVLKEAFGNQAREANTVICWVLPITEETRISNRKETRFPSRKWGRTRNYGEIFNNVLRMTIIDYITDSGGQAAAPMLMKEWDEVDDPDIGIASTWSERHAAYAAGLGTFSINDGFITPRGIAHRVGSVVTDLYFKPSEQPYWDHRENCLTCRNITCGACMVRCPVGAISLDGHDKDLCHRYTYGPEFKKLGQKYGAEKIGCGLCQTDVPCEDRIPEGTNNSRS